MVSSIYSTNAAQHRNPVPNAAIHKGLLVTSGILGKELDTDNYPYTAKRQIELAFQYLVEILRDAGATPDDVVKLDLFFADKSDRPIANSYWLDLWPDETKRPARQAHLSTLPEGCKFQIVAMAVL